MKAITARPCAELPFLDALHLVLVDKPCIPFSRQCVSSPMNPLHLEFPLEEIPWGKAQHSGEFSANSQSTNPGAGTNSHTSYWSKTTQPVLVTGFEPSILGSRLGLNHSDSQGFAQQHPLLGDEQGLLHMSKAPAMFRLM